MIRQILAILAFFLICPHPLAAADPPRAFLAAVEAYQQGNYQEAAKAFTKLAETGIDNGALYYNMGNAWLRAGDLGRAILNYERALRLIPADPDLKFNLQYARSLTRDKAEDNGMAWLQVLLFWNHSLGFRTIQWCALGFSLLFWAGILWSRFQPAPFIRAITLIALVWAVLFSGTVFARFYCSHAHPRGVILAEEIAIRSGLSDQATELFRLHAGTLVRIDRMQNGYCRISFPPDKMGWVPRSAVGIIQERFAAPS